MSITKFFSRKQDIPKGPLKMGQTALGPQDIPPYSIYRYAAWAEGEWALITKVNLEGIFVAGLNFMFTWEELARDENNRFRIATDSRWRVFSK